MFKLNVWYKENGTLVRYIQESETISELLEQMKIDIDLLDIVECHIYKSIQQIYSIHCNY
jgi:DNA-binding transcriptional regulator WhiA